MCVCYVDVLHHIYLASSKNHHAKMCVSCHLLRESFIMIILSDCFLLDHTHFLYTLYYLRFWKDIFLKFTLSREKRYIFAYARTFEFLFYQDFYQKSLIFHIIFFTHQKNTLSPACMCCLVLKQVFFFFFEPEEKQEKCKQKIFRLSFFYHMSIECIYDRSELSTLGSRCSYARNISRLLFFCFVFKSDKGNNIIDVDCNTLLSCDIYIYIYVISVECG